MRGRVSRNGRWGALGRRPSGQLQGQVREAQPQGENLGPCLDTKPLSTGMTGFVDPCGTCIRDRLLRGMTLAGHVRCLLLPERVTRT